MGYENATIGWAGARQIQRTSERRKTEQWHSLALAGSMKLSLLPFVFFSCSVFGQGQFLVDTLVKGFVFDERTKMGTEAVISGIGSDMSKFEVGSSKGGVFVLTDREISSGISYLLTISSPKRDGVRNWFPSSMVKINSLPLSNDSLPLILEFPVNFATVCRETPYLFHKKNSASPDVIDNDELVDFIITLNENPTIVVEIIGRANFDEDNPMELSKTRATNVARFVTDRGIDPDRLSVVWTGDSVPHIMDRTHGLLPAGQKLHRQFIDSLKSYEAIEEARRFNGSTHFRILRTNFVPKD